MLALGIGLAGVVPAATANSHANSHGLGKQHRQAKHAVSHAKADLDESSRAFRASYARLTRTRRELADATTTLARTQRSLSRATVVYVSKQAALDAAQRNLTAAQTSVALTHAEILAERAAIGRVAASSYQNGTPQLLGLSVLLAARTPGEVTSQINDVGLVVAAQQARLRRLDQLKAGLVRVAARKAADERVVAAARQQAAANLAVKQRLEQQASSERTHVARLVASARQAEAQARAQQHASRRALARAKVRERRIIRRIMRSSGRVGYHGATNGFLNRPTVGPITSPFGMRLSPITHTWGLHDGTDFGAPCGAPEWAAASGVVVSEYYSYIWGNRLFLNLGTVNGKNLTVIYNHIHDYVVGVGAHVRRGQVLAHVGTTGWSTGCHLHFTVMVNGVAQNPMGWI